MDKKTIFGLDEKEFTRRQSVPIEECDSNSPIVPERSALSACLSGSHKLLAEHKEMLRDIYRTTKK